MIKVIVGLGNPGQKYEKNRHNAGFLFLDRLAELCGQSWANEPKFQGVVANCIFQSKKVTLLKPQTFMNRSGLSVAAFSRFYKINSEQILVVHDEIDLGVGAVKLRNGGGHAGHNGLRDIIANLGGKGFYRLRLGVGRPEAGGQVSDYVLSNPSAVEREALFSVFSKVEIEMERIISGDFSLAMNNLN
ncbi:MAG: aminoacyl-tRNA hydrolase [Methylococcaceae bacterium]|nr:aminoacyl-tRNA hydrolase [Methylococcaceae bacterium]